jgi:hypothetical protein
MKKLIRKAKDKLTCSIYVNGKWKYWHEMTQEEQETNYWVFEDEYENIPKPQNSIKRTNNNTYTQGKLIFQ